MNAGVNLLQPRLGIQVRNIQIKFSVLFPRKNSRLFSVLSAPLYLAPISKVLFLVYAISRGFLGSGPSFRPTQNAVSRKGGPTSKNLMDSH